MGIETTSSYVTKDHAWNEISGRYTPVNDFYVPSKWRKQSKDNKQASEDTLNTSVSDNATLYYEKFLDQMQKVYKDLLAVGVAKEQARIVLPLSQYTEVYWTASFQAIMNFIELRNETTAQWEIQQYAASIQTTMFELFPITTGIWLTDKD